MISYDAYRMSHMLFSPGSMVVPIFWWCLPTCLLTIGLKVFLLISQGSMNFSLDSPDKFLIMLWGVFQSCLSFLIVFRANMATARYWEGCTLVEQARGSWLNAVSNLIAFRSRDADRRAEVRRFQHLLVRLVSLLFATSLSEVADDTRFRLNVLDLDGIDVERLRYLDSRATKREIVLQWIQTLVVDGDISGVIKISPPLLGRVFQELSAGMASINDARKITLVPFPFPFAQVTFLMIGFFSYVAIPLGCGLYMSFGRAIAYSMICPSVFWGVYHISIDLELPFGLHGNKLPLDRFQNDLNCSLSTLLSTESQKVTGFDLPYEALEEEVVVKTVSIESVQTSVEPPPEPHLDGRVAHKHEDPTYIGDVKNSIAFISYQQSIREGKLVRQPSFVYSSLASLTRAGHQGQSSSIDEEALATWPSQNPTIRCSRHSHGDLSHNEQEQDDIKPNVYGQHPSISLPVKASDDGPQKGVQRLSSQVPSKVLPSSSDTTDPWLEPKLEAMTGMRDPEIKDGQILL